MLAIWVSFLNTCMSWAGHRSTAAMNLQQIFLKKWFLEPHLPGKGAVSPLTCAEEEKNIVLERGTGKYLWLLCKATLGRRGRRRARGGGLDVAVPCPGDHWSLSSLQLPRKRRKQLRLPEDSLESIVFENWFSAHSNCWLLLPKNWACQPLPASPLPRGIGRERDYTL